MKISESTEFDENELVAFGQGVNFGVTEYEDIIPGRLQGDLDSRNSSHEILVVPIRC